MTGLPSTAYMAVMGFGTPPQNLSVVVDTGSSNLAVAGAASAGSTAHFTSAASSTFVARAGTVSVTYLLGSWTGNRVSDVVTLFGAGVASVVVEFASIYTSANFYQPNATYAYNGILGMAYASLAFPSASPVTPYFDTLVAGGLDDTFSLQLCAGRMVSQFSRLIAVATPSFMHLGGGAAAVADLAAGPFFYAPLTEERYYGVSVARIALGDSVAPISCSDLSSPHAIVDSGTTNLLVTPAVFEWFKGAFLNVVSFNPPTDQSAFFAGTACIVLPNANLNQLPNLTLTLLGAAGTEFDLVVHPSHYLRAVSVAATLPAGSQCRALGVQPTSCGMILGVVVMGSFTVVFDRAQKRVGFATSTCANATGLGVLPPIVSRPATISSCPIDASVCSAKSSTNIPLIVGVSVGVAAGVALLVFVVMKVVAGKSAAAASASGTAAAPAQSQLVRTKV